MLKERVTDVLESEARTAAQRFVDRFLSVMETGKLDMSNFMRDLGKTLVADFLEEFLAQTLLASGLITGGKSLGATAGLGLFKLFGRLFGGGGGEDTIFTGKGGYLPGNFVPIGALRKFATGGMASGPTLGVIGEEGPEIVARMKPARPGDGNGDIKQTIWIVDNRPPRIGPRDVVLYVAADMRSGGQTSQAVQNVIKRT